jgi:NhaA family Na+:H+ antiporter
MPGYREAHLKLAVLTGPLVAALLAATVLRRRNRHSRLLEETEADGQGP